MRDVSPLSSPEISSPSRSGQQVLRRQLRTGAVLVGLVIAAAASAQNNITVDTNASGWATYDALNAGVGPSLFSNFGVRADASVGGPTVNVGISGGTTFSFPDFTNGQILVPTISTVNVGLTPTWGGSISSDSSFSASVKFHYDIGPFSGDKDIFSQSLGAPASDNLASGNVLSSGTASDSASGNLYTFSLGEDAVAASASASINVGVKYTNSVKYDPNAQYGITSWVSKTKGGGPIGLGTKQTPASGGSLDPGIFNPGGFSTGDQVYLEFEPSVQFDMPVTPYTDLSLPITGRLYAEALGETLADITFPSVSPFDLPLDYDPWDVNVLWNSDSAFGIPVKYESETNIGDGTCLHPEINCSVFVVDGQIFTFTPTGFNDSGPNNLTAGGVWGNWNSAANGGGPLPQACDVATGKCYDSTDPNMPIGRFTVVSSVTQVGSNNAPEPGSLALLGIGIVGMFAGTRGRNRIWRQGRCDPRPGSARCAHG